MKGSVSPIPFRIALALAAAFTLGAAAAAQFSNPEPSPTQVYNTALLHPPAGVRVAIVEFEDLECPDCAHANPVLLEAAERFHVPLVRHDFPLPLPSHVWAFQAAVDARWFDTQSPTLGDQFRDALFAAQPTILNQDDLQRFAARFAEQHQLRFPAAPDPNGKLTELVKADVALGREVGIRHTPTIWVVTNQKSSAPFVESVDRARLFTLIEDAVKETEPAQH
jgi:protein-disulfide isomerase